MIAYALQENLTVVTHEADQTKQPPTEKYNYKIPLICQEQGVKYIRMIDMLRKLDVKI